MAFAPRGPCAERRAIPGDKSISHRALMLAALAVGREPDRGPVRRQRRRATIAALRAMGARIDAEPDGAWTVDGVGVGGLLQPETAARHGQSRHLGAAADGARREPSDPRAIFTGDASLSPPADGRGWPRRFGGSAPESTPARRPAAADWSTALAPGRPAAPPARRRLGAGEVGAAARRAQHAGHHRDRRGGADPRPSRADARAVRRRHRGRRRRHRACAARRSCGRSASLSPATPRPPPSSPSRP